MWDEMLKQVEQEIPYYTDYLYGEKYWRFRELKLSAAVFEDDQEIEEMKSMAEDCEDEEQEQIICLHAPEKDTCLSGTKRGHEMFERQVENVINYDLDGRIMFLFPEQVKKISSSFLQGFFWEVQREIGLRGIEDKVEIRSSAGNLKKLVLEAL